MRRCDVYEAAVTAVAGAERPLEEYLRAFVACARDLRDPVAPEQFVELLRRALTAPAPPLPDEPRDRLERTAVEQVHDLRRAEREGVFENADRSFGVDIGESRWFNFDVEAFVECGVAGFIGYDAEAAAPPLTREDLAEFLYCGQVYE